MSSTFSMKPSDGADRLLLAFLLGEPCVPREVCECDRHAQPAEVEGGPIDLGLHVADDVLLDEVRQEPLVEVVHHGAASGRISSARSAISSAIWITGTLSRMSGSCT